MLVRRARFVDPADLAEMPSRPSGEHRPHPRAGGTGCCLASSRVRLGALALGRARRHARPALVGGLLAVGASRLLLRPYPVLAGGPRAPLLVVPRGLRRRAVDHGRRRGLWHDVGDAWQAPAHPAPARRRNGDGHSRSVPTARFWVSGDRRASPCSTTESGAPPGRPARRPLRGLVVAPDGTVWAAHGSRARRAAARGPTGYSAQTVGCPRVISRIAATTDGTVYVGGFSYAGGGEGLARFDGMRCDLVDPLGDGQVHELSDLSAGPGGASSPPSSTRTSTAAPSRSGW